MSKNPNRKLSEALLAVAAILITGLCTSWSMNANEECRTAYLSADKMHVLYIGLENPITVMTVGIKPEEVGVMPIGVNVREINGKYFVNPDSGVRACTIKLLDKTNHKFLGEQQYRIRPVPKPDVMLGANMKPTISQAELQAVNRVHSGLGATFPIEGISFQVQKYTFTHSPKEGKGLYQVTVEGNNISPEIKERLATVSPGDMIIISDVHLAGPGGVRSAPGCFYTVK